MKPLTKEDFVRILKESNGSVLKSAVLVLRTEGIHLNFTDKAVEEIAKVAEEVNNLDEDTGARRLIQIIDIVLDDINFFAPDIFEEKNQNGKFIVYIIN
jgi:ATP-dependent HslUV protease ATP-binding subunit HslU